MPRKPKVGNDVLVDWVRKHGTDKWGLFSKSIGGIMTGDYASKRFSVVRDTKAAKKAVSDFKKTQPSVRVKEPTPEEAFQQRTDEQALKDKIVSIESELRVAAREKNLRDTLWEVAKATAPKLPYAAPLWTPEKKTKPIVETAYQFLSDLHAYEYVSAERTRGHNEYTHEIMAARVAQCVASHIGIINGLREGPWDFPEIAIGLGGDNVSGTIHDLERHSDAPNVVLAVYGCAWLLAQAIRELSRQYGKVYVYGVGGNHARLPDAKKKQMKDPTRTWDYMIYLLLTEMLGEQDNVEFWFPAAWGAQVSIRGWNVLLGHGDDIRSWNTIPWYGIKRRATQMQALESARGNVIHYQMLGHFHTSASIEQAAGEAMINGSVIGGTEFSIDGMGECSPPKQWLVAFHEKHGMTHRWPLLLEPQEKNIPKFTTTPWLELQRKSDGGIPIWKVA